MRRMSSGGASPLQWQLLQPKKASIEVEKAHLKMHHVCLSLQHATVTQFNEDSFQMLAAHSASFKCMKGGVSIPLKLKHKLQGLALLALHHEVSH